MASSASISIASENTTNVAKPNIVSISRSPSNMLHAGLSLSPTQSTLHDRFREAQNQTNAIRQPKVLHPVENEDLRLLLLENISKEAVNAFKKQGFQVDHFTKAWSEDELLEKIGQYHAIGIRSKTKITKRVLTAANKVSSPFNLRVCASLITLRHSSLLSDASASAPTKSTSKAHLRLASPSSIRPSRTLAQWRSSSCAKSSRSLVNSLTAPGS